MRYRLRRISRCFVLLIILSILLLVLFRIRYNQVILDLAKTQVTNSTSDLINDAVADQIAIDGVGYDQIVYFENNTFGIL